jgi:NitT/TauT family transport system ATP-binding protein
VNESSTGNRSSTRGPVSSDRIPEPLVAFHEVTFAFDGQPVLDGLDLGVMPGSVVSVVGPSGSGKTTLLSLLAGLHEPASGAIVWNRRLKQPGRHSLSMLFQKDTLLPWLNVADNIGLHHRLTRSRLSKAERRERIAELISLAGLEGAENKYPYQLSGGMRRRAAFLAAVLPRPHLLLLDEPFAAVDEPTRVAIHQDIRSIVKTYDITVVLVTHDIAEAVSLADEVVILTHRPARVHARHTVPFDGPRDMLALRDDPRFLELYGTLWDELGEQVRAARGTGADASGGNIG